MADKKVKSVTLKAEETDYSVHLENGEIVTVQATSAEEAVAKSKAKKE